MLDFLYSCLITPIEMIVEMVFSIMYKVLGNPGIAIIAVSIVIQTLVIPLYNRAEEIQSEERRRQQDMAHWVSHIKKAFSGEERYMMLSAYYRQQGYKSWYALKSSLSVLLQIPFFIAAYHYLSNLFELSEKSFLFIRDLSRPDMALTIAGISINVLPILMTVINILSGVIYTRNHTVREKIQVYGFALIFLVLLYNSPSGLVLYWTTNNLYSLVKNLIKEIRHGSGLVKTTDKCNDSKRIFNEQDYKLYYLFIWSALFIVAFVGMLIPLNVIKSSASEFVNKLYSPLWIVARNTAVYLGFFVIWGSCFYLFTKSRKIRVTVNCALIFLCLAAVINYMFFGNDFGRMSALFVYDELPQYGKISLAVNSGIMVLVLIVTVVSMHYQKQVLSVIRVVLFATVIFCVVGCISVAGQVKNYENSLLTSKQSDEAIFHFSRQGKNVAVIMLDRAISGYIPYILDEKPELIEQLDGFTYYPNTISYGRSTNYGSPALYGGYEYTPEAMNDRPEESIPEKHDESLLVVPAILSENGYNVTVCDPPYAGTYRDVIDLSIYDSYSNVNAYITQGQYMDDTQVVLDAAYKPVQEGNVFWYSLMRAMPVVLQKIIYNDGNYLFVKEVEIYTNFLDSYSTLQKMSELTEFSSDGQNNYFIMRNMATHDTAALMVPDYIPEPGARNKLSQMLDYYENMAFPNGHEGLNMENLTQVKHYQCNLVSLLALGSWFDYLRENDCWDNTRVIIVADHGNSLGDIEKTLLSDELEIESFNPLLMVKDFNSHGFTVSDDFMTNADVPTITFEGLIDNPVNPFTGKVISSDAKNGMQKVTTSHNFNTSKNNGNIFDTDDSAWYDVTPGDIFDINNWKKVE